MTYPPQGQPGDPYGPPGSQPSDGYAPGQAGGYPPPQYTQPEAAPPGYPSQPGYAPQPGYPPQGQPGYPDPYGQYGPPPVAPVTRGSGGTALLIVVVLILMIGGGVAGYLLLGGDSDEGTTTAGEETTTGSGEDESEDDQQDDGGEEPLPDGEGLVVDSLGASTPAPGGDWEPYSGPGETGHLGLDVQAEFIQHTDTWISYMEVGLFDAAYLPYDAADLEGTADETMAFWAESFAFGSTQGLTIADTELTSVEVDGRPAALAETTVSWDSSENTDDLFEDIAILVVDVDGVNAFIGLVSVPESGTDNYGPAVDALLATTFQGETA